jgi:hypothetical protein
MSYRSIADAATDPALRARIAACIAEQGFAGDTLQTGALSTADKIQWQVCAEPGWGAAWESASITNPTSAGNDPAVISDEMILAAVQKHLGVDAP